MRNKNFKGVWLSVLMTTSIVTLMIIPLLYSSPVHADLAARAPIFIKGNDNFTLANGVTSGSGAEDDPFVIENWDISVAGRGAGISIESTDAYFVIRSCRLYGGFFSRGIIFNNVVNGKMDKVEVYNSGSSGISLDSSSNNYIANCTVENTFAGYFSIEISYFSINNRLENCVVKNNDLGIIIDDDSLNNLIENCIIENNERGGVFIENCQFNDIVNCVIENTPWASGIYFGFGSEQNSVQNCVIRYGIEGIRFEYSLNNTLKNSTIENYSTGINFADGSPNNIINNCTIENCGTGIYFSKDSLKTIITNSHFKNNSVDFNPEPTTRPTVRWPLVSGIVVTIAIIGSVAAIYVKRRQGGGLKVSGYLLFVIAIVITISAGVAGYFLLKGGESKEAGFKTYTDENYHFKFDYPENWNFNGGPDNEFPGMVARFSAEPPENLGLGDTQVQFLIFDRIGFVNYLENEFPENQTENLSAEENVLLGYLKPLRNSQILWLENASLADLNGYISSLENQSRYVSLFENENIPFFLLIGKPTKIDIKNHYGVAYLSKAHLFKTSWDNLLFLQNVQILKDNYMYSLEIMAQENYPSYTSLFNHEIDSFSFLS